MREKQDESNEISVATNGEMRTLGRRERKVKVDETANIVIDMN